MLTTTLAIANILMSILGPLAGVYVGWRLARNDSDRLRKQDVLMAAYKKAFALYRYQLKLGEARWRQDPEIRQGLSDEERQEWDQTHEELSHYIFIVSGVFGPPMLEFVEALSDVCDPSGRQMSFHTVRRNLTKKA